MGNNGAEDVKICGVECPETTVEIKIKTLDSQTYTLRVDKCVPVPALKQQIATVTGVLSEQQRLICRGKVLKDDQLLSAYHVEDGHTLHLVVRQPSSENAPDSQGNASASSSRHVQGNRVGPGIVVGTYNLFEHGDGAFPDLNRIISAVLGSFGVARVGNEGIDVNGLGAATLGNMRNSDQLQTDQASTMDQSGSASSVSAHPTAFPVEAQPPVIPDSLTTLTQYLTNLTEEFRANAWGQIENAQTAGIVGADRPDFDASSHSARQRGLPTPASLAEVMLSMRQLFTEQAAQCFLQFSRQLENQARVTEPTERMRIQSYALRTGDLFQKLGALLLELGRTTMTLRMGQTAADAVVNAGPAVFVSTAGPNPIMVQPLPFQPGTNFGAIPVGTVQNGSGLSGPSVGSGFTPRNIDIRIRTGSFMPSTYRREPAGSQRPGQATPAASNGGNSDQETSGGTRSSSVMESGVRVVPMRTVVTTVPASAGHSTSNSSRGSMGIFYPVLARVQPVSSRNSNNSGAAQASNRNNSHGVVAEQPPNPDSAREQQTNGSSGAEGNFGSFNELSSSEEFSTQLQSRIDQIYRTFFTGENLHPENVNDRSGGNNSVSGDSVAAEDIDNSQETAMAARDGVFLSNVLRHIMPIISETAGTSDNSSSDRSNLDGDRSDHGSIQGRENTERASSSHRCHDPSLSPSSKRQKRE
ncbi:ubiquitin-like domain-containing protein CIP73 [Lycium ferocissimum]|uniref:ubiquitin-like domain-containing protein CIP73 n=1 Tax=Lycium ferocissimum TaxID=112874 RepID=UPI0028156ED8|nr:ubiquitin-like domain-containing protein CIP73 [Lycium ferocissimum]XP_059280705.1 ubiquitin-like domain-containing protein CIP73 [Lycium ferocissimum]XP_059280706.1 ubiquitin-like domain-containing protein CIP73 [Lycium ferocissimum]